MRTALMLLMAVALGGPAFAQEPDPDPDWERQAEDAEEDEAMAADEALVGESVETDAAEEEDWWVEGLADESDDAIPTDTELDPAGSIWEVVEYENDGDDYEEVSDTMIDGVRQSGDMPTIKRRVAAPRPPGAAGEDTPYAMGGKPVRDTGAAWQAQIFYPGNAPQWAEKIRQGTPLWQLQHMCGGTLIRADWVLTAAHCIDEGMVKSGYRVRLGAEDISKDNGVTFKIDRIVRHSQYDDKPHPKAPAPPRPPPNMYANDIALVHIVNDGPPQALDPKQIHPIDLFEGQPPRSGTEVTGTGWGKTQPVEQHAPNAVLLKVDLQVMDTDTCRKQPNYGPERISEKVICAARKGQSTCRGDSGGPLIFTNGAPKLVGIISWGKMRCTGDGQPGVYTRVGAYSEWIRQALQLDPSRNALP